MSAGFESPLLEGAYLVSDDPKRLDFAVIHAFLSRAYWSEGIAEDLVRRAFANALSFGLYRADAAAGESAQVGGARVITDRATFAYLADVFVLPAHRGKGLAKGLMAAILAHPDLQGLRRWTLATRDAHGLYAAFGFRPLERPEIFMERHDPLVYLRQRAG